MTRGADKASLRPALETIRHGAAGAARGVKHAVADTREEIGAKGGRQRGWRPAARARAACGAACGAVAAAAGLAL
jgi:hypothetical protein